jgi:hypothetical protein
MSKENTAGLGVNSRYGPVDIPDGAGGVVKTEGAYNELTIEFGGEDVNADLYHVEIDARNIRFVDWIVEVEEAPVGLVGPISVGTYGTASVDGFNISAVQAASVGLVSLPDATFGGTWANTIIDNAGLKVAVASDDVLTGGKIRVVARYVKV